MDISQMLISIWHLSGILELIAANVLCGWAWYDVFAGKDPKAMIGVMFSGILAIVLIIGAITTLGWNDCFKLWYLHIIPGITIARFILMMVTNS